MSESYTSDVFLNAPDILFLHLSEIFKSFLFHGTVTLEILSCAFMPLFKGGLKSANKSDSYRTLAGASRLLKLFEYVVLDLWGHLLATDSMQFGFKSGVSTTQCTWLVLEVATYFMRRGVSVNSCLLDCSKAFDKCRFDKLFTTMLSKSVPAVVVRALVFAYQEQKGWIRTGERNSDTFQISNGTRQGSVLSPLLFTACYLDGLIVKLRKMELGCFVEGWWMGCLGYCDDLILLAPNREVLQKMVSVCEEYGEEMNLEFSTDPVPAKSKTKCILFSGTHKRVSYPKAVKLKGKELPWVEKGNTWDTF